jgi:hypothetical protein
VNKNALGEFYISHGQLWDIKSLYWGWRNKIDVQKFAEG